MGGEETEQQDNSKKALHRLSKSVARECGKGNAEEMIGVPGKWLR
jgi:hypothetical protein